MLQQVLNMSDPYIPEGEEPPRLGAVPVRFFGTYAFSWIESKRAIEPFDEEHLEHASSSRQPEFQRGVSEAKHFQVRIHLHQSHLRLSCHKSRMQDATLTASLSQQVAICLSLC